MISNYSVLQVSSVNVIDNWSISSPLFSGNFIISKYAIHIKNFSTIHACATISKSYNDLKICTKSNSNWKQCHRNESTIQCGCLLFFFFFVALHERVELKQSKNYKLHRKYDFCVLRFCRFSFIHTFRTVQLQTGSCVRLHSLMRSPIVVVFVCASNFGCVFVCTGSPASYKYMQTTELKFTHSNRNGENDTNKQSDVI